MGQIQRTFTAAELNLDDEGRAPESTIRRRSHDPVVQVYPGVPAVLRARRSDFSKLIPALVRAFDQDPLLEYTCRSGAERTRSREIYFETCLEAHNGHQYVFTTPERHACAVWEPPGQALSTLQIALRAPSVFRMLGARRLARGLGAFLRLQEERPVFPHYYLALLGVDPEHQGRGEGSALVEHVLKLADAEGVHAHLETANESNLDFYRKHGFKVINTFDFGPNSPRAYILQRVPKGRHGK